MIGLKARLERLEKKVKPYAGGVLFLNHGEPVPEGIHPETVVFIMPEGYRDPVGEENA